MIQTVEAVVDGQGRVRLLGPVHVEGLHRALVTVLDEPAEVPGETALLAEATLEVVLVPFPFSDLSAASDLPGRRGPR